MAFPSRRTLSKPGASERRSCRSETRVPRIRPPPMTAPGTSVVFTVAAPSTIEAGSLLERTSAATVDTRMISGRIANLVDLTGIVMDNNERRTGPGKARESRHRHTEENEPNGHHSVPFDGG